MFCSRNQRIAGIPIRPLPLEHADARLAVPARRGFSLVELLVVMAVVGVMGVAAAVGLSAAAQNARLNQAIVSVGGMLELARRHAMANNTYVHVGFGSAEGGEVLVAALFESRDGRPLFTQGTVYDLSTSAGDAAAAPVGRPARHRGLGLVSTPAEDYGGWTPPPGPTEPVGLNQDFHFIWMGQRYDSGLWFGPDGRTRVSPDAPDALIEFGFEPAGGVAGSPFVCRISGLTGLFKLHRP